MTIMVTGKTKETKAGVNSQRHKGGRPTLPKARRRSKSVTVKFSKIDYETLRIRSRKANRRLAEYIRETALQAEPPTAHTTVDASIFRNLAGVANRSNSVRLQGEQPQPTDETQPSDESLPYQLQIERGS